MFIVIVQSGVRYIVVNGGACVYENLRQEVSNAVISVPLRTVSLYTDISVNLL